jgi:hypothetical protein
VKKSDAAPPAGPEADVFKIYVWAMLVPIVVLAGLYFWAADRAEAAEKSVAQGRKLLDDFAEAKSEVNSLLKVYSDNNEEDARYEPFTWFSGIWQRKGIDNSAINLGAWRDQPLYVVKGGYYEEQIEIKVNSKNPLPRESIAKLCHEIERASTRLRILELKLSRKLKKDEYDKDEWSGRIQIGYRWQKAKE